MTAGTFWRSRPPRGQASVEYVLVLGAVVVAVTAAALIFVPAFRHGVERMQARGWINWNLPMDWMPSS